MNETFTHNTPLNITDIPVQPSAEPMLPESGNTRELKLVPNNVPAPQTKISMPMTYLALDISRHLKAPKLSNVKPNTVSYEQAHKGININIPGAAQMRFGDTLVFYWGTNKSSTQLHLRNISKDSTVRVLCISYQFISDPQYGLVDVYYEVHRDHQLIGTSPAVRVTVNRDPTPPATPRQRAAKDEPGDKDAA